MILLDCVEARKKRKIRSTPGKFEHDLRVFCDPTVLLLEASLPEMTASRWKISLLRQLISIRPAAFPATKLGGRKHKMSCLPNHDRDLFHIVFHENGGPVAEDFPYFWQRFRCQHLVDSDRPKLYRRCDGQDLDWVSGYPLSFSLLPWSIITVQGDLCPSRFISLIKSKPRVDV